MRPGHIAFAIALIGSCFVPIAADAQDTDSSSASGKLIAQGEGLAKSGSWQKAQEYFLQACSQDPSNVIALHDLAMSYAHTDRLNDAAECERKALAIDENYVPAHIELAWVLAKLDDKEGAREHLKKALELQPDNKIARKNLEAINIPRLRRQRTETAPNANTQKLPSKIQKATETPVSKALVARGISMYRQGKYDVAKRFFEQALQNCPESTAARSSLGVILGTSGDLDGQIREQRRVLQADPKNSIALANLAWALAQKGENKDAHYYYQKALEYNPNLVEAQSGQGLLLCKMGKWEAGLAYLKETVRLHPESAMLRLSLGVVLQSINRNGEALAELQEASRLAPNSLEVKTRLAVAYLESENFSKAVDCYKQLVERYPANGELRIGFGLALTKTNDINGAYLQFKKASELDKNMAAAHAALSMVEELRGRFSQAESEARLAQEKDTGSTFIKESVERIANSRKESEM